MRRDSAVKCGDCHDNDHWKPSAPTITWGATNSRWSARMPHRLPRLPHRADRAAEARHHLRGLPSQRGSAWRHSSRRLRSCHGQESWRSGISFDHDLTDFPLLGLHAWSAARSATRAWPSAQRRPSCIDCHSARGRAQRRARQASARAVILTNGWALWSFDHAKQTALRADRRARQAQCADCHHEQPGSGKTSPLCVACHRQDDRHQGAYGSQCERCHTTYSWKGARVQ